MDKAKTGHMGRVYLNKGDTVRLFPDCGNMGAGTYKIGDVLIEDGYSVCYQSKKDGKTGKLLEFYPMDSQDSRIPVFFHMNRCRDGKLMPISDAMGNRFAEMKKRFGKSYQMLSVLVEKSRSCRKSFKDFVPPFQFCYWQADGRRYDFNNGRPDRIPGTAYIWMPDIGEKRCLEDCLKDLQEAPMAMAVQKAFWILSVVISITECIEYMHCAGLLHLDIRPSNFVLDCDEKFSISQEYHVSMDISRAFFAPGNEYPVSIGQDAYMAPEIGRMTPDNRADIYSIGAMMYYAFTGQPSGNLKKGKSAGRMKSAETIFHELCNAPMIRSMKADDRKYFASHISRILCLCLSDRRDSRYESCENLLSDLINILHLPKLQIKAYPL